MTMSNVVLRTDKLCKNFGGLKAVADLDFEIREREIVAIIGPNGSGKTTFFNLIMNLYEATGGSILFGPDQLDISSLGTHEINRLGIARTFQNLRLFPNLTVLENTLIGMNRHLSGGYFSALLRPPALLREEQEAEQKALQTLSFFGPRLLSMCNEPAAALSYANRRRLEIARVLASDPKLILLDEPVAGMNPTETAEVMEDIKRINKMGYTVLLIEHDMALVRGVAGRVVAFDHGTKVTEGTFQEVCNNPHVIESYLGRRSVHTSREPV